MNTPTALDEYMSAMHDAMELCDKVKAAIDHQDDPDHIDYAHVGNMLHTKHTLAGLAEFLGVK